MLQKMIRIVRKDSSISKRNIIKVSSIVKKMFKIYENFSDLLREEHLRNDLLVEYFLLFGAIFKCGRIIY